MQKSSVSGGQVPYEACGHLLAFRIVIDLNAIRQ